MFKSLLSSMHEEYTYIQIVSFFAKREAELFVKA